MGAGEVVVVEVWDVLSEAVAGMLSFLRKGSARRCRRSVILLVDLVSTFSIVDVQVDRMLESLLSRVEVFSFLCLSLLRILFLPMMGEKMLLL